MDFFFMSNMNHVEISFWNSAEGAGEAIHGAACATLDLVASQGMSDARDDAEAFLCAVKAGAEGTTAATAAATAESFEKLAEITPAVVSSIADSSRAVKEQIGQAAEDTTAPTAEGFGKLVEVTKAIVSRIADSSRAMGEQIGHTAVGIVAATIKGFQNLVEIIPGVVCGIADSSRAVGEQIGHAAASTAVATAEGFRKLGKIVLFVFSIIVSSSRAIGGRIPVVATVLPATRVIGGTIRASVGTCGLVAGCTVALLEALYGAVAAPIDGGASLGGVVCVARLALGLTNQAVKFAHVVGTVHPENGEIDGIPEASTGRCLVLVEGAAALLAGFCDSATAAFQGGAAFGEALSVWSLLRDALG